MLVLILNGAVTINDDELYFEDFIVESEEELDLPFDFLIDDEDDYIQYQKEDFDQVMDELLDGYSEILSETCACPECIKEILLEFLDDFIEM